MDINPIILINRKLSIRKSPIHGYGLFSDEFIQYNEIITQSPVIIFPPGIDYTEMLRNYVFAFNGKMMVALSYLSYINSSLLPNTVVSYDDLHSIITITAIQDIHPHEEITLKYM